MPRSSAPLRLAAACLLAAGAATAHAQPSVTMYGLIDLSFGAT